MALPYKIATLLYCFNEAGDILLLERAQEPNRGLFSPCGGKLKVDSGESPYQCACREAMEEMGIELQASDLHLTGIVSEFGYQGAAHWLMFLFEVRRSINQLPPPHREGIFHFVRPAELETLPLPETDRAMIWPLFWRHRGGFFAAHCRNEGDERYQWTVEQSSPKIAPI
ncbi:MAG TPA: NUDIX domain-containing protein [Candidatus Limnocylindria bacterium]|jgi:8-oxo-dGTP diphosphatase|nr:NUDIX domain-containing protein [Candidatus Limnocylindria bacterium]